MTYWHDQAVLYGVQVKAFFFDADAAQIEQNLARRNLPFLGLAPLKTMFTEPDRQDFYYGQLVARPDAVFEHGNGLIVVDIRHAGCQPHTREQWQREIKLKDILQCLIAGYTVAQNYQKLTGCVLRYPNVCYLPTPDAGMIGTMLDLIPLAKQYYKVDRRISAAQIALFAVDRVRGDY